MSVDRGQQAGVSICNLCQRPGVNTQQGPDGELYHGDCLEALLAN